MLTLSTSSVTGEALVVCVVVSCPEPRPLRIRPKKTKQMPLVTGDEQIDIVSEVNTCSINGVSYLHIFSTVELV